MRKLTYSMGVSLDGYITGPDGRHDWSEPDEELHRFHNQQMAEVDAHLLGRRLYEDMVMWETEEQPGGVRSEFAEAWIALEKVVFSTTLDTVRAAAASRPAGSPRRSPASVNSPEGTSRWAAPAWPPA